MSTSSLFECYAVHVLYYAHKLHIFLLGIILQRMFRHASHRLIHSPIATLDFLLPRHYTSIKPTARRDPAAAHLKRVAPLPARQLPLHPTPTSSSFSKPGVQHSARSTAVPSPSSGWNLEADQAVLFDETYARIGDALESGDVHAAGELWSTLDRSSLLPFLGPSHHNKLSKLITDLITVSEEQGSSWSSTESLVLDDIAVSVATSGDPRGFIARMRYLILHDDPDAALHLFTRLATLLRVRGARLETQLEESSFQGDVLLPDESAHDTPSDVFPPSIACLAITAFAAKDSFFEAVKAVLSTNTLLTASYVRIYFANLRVDPALRTKAEMYARRIVIAQVLTRPGSFQRHVSNLSQDMNDKNLQQLHEHLVSALTETQPWLTMNPSAVSEQTPVLLPDFAWSILLRAFLHCRRLDLAEKLWDDMTKLGVRPTMDTWTSLLDGYAELRMADRALVAWKLLRNEGVQPSIMAYRALIYGLFSAGRPEQAMERFQEFCTLMKKGAYPADDPTVMILYNTVLYWLLANSREANAQTLLQQMEEAGPKPDVVSYNTFMRHYAKVTKPGAIGAMLRKMDAVGVVADNVTYSTILTSLLPIQKDAASVVRTLMKARGAQMNVATYTTIIDHLMKEESDAGLEAALELLRLMEAEEDEALHPNAVTYTTVLSGIHRRQHWPNLQTQEEYVRLIADRMKKRDLMHSKVTYNILIGACLGSPSTEGVRHALKYYREMVRHNVPIKEDTWFILLSGLARRKAWDEADTIVEEIEKSGKTLSAWLSNAMARVRKREDERRFNRRTSRG